MLMGSMAPSAFAAVIVSVCCMTPTQRGPIYTLYIIDDTNDINNHPDDMVGAQPQ